MQEEKSSYRQIMKATSIFGGVQVINIIIQIIRSKFIAVLLGPAGIGINNLLNSTTGLIAGFTSFGLGTSAVKRISEAFGNGNVEKAAVIITVLKRLVWLTGFLGAIITFVFSSWLSVLTFGNSEYSLAFRWISITLLLNQISLGQTVALRGMRKINLMAKSSLSGSFFGLFVSVPIYYVWGIDGIVPAIIVSSIISLLRSWYFFNKVKLVKVQVPKETTLLEGKQMLALGFMLSLTSLYVMVKNYGIRIYLSHEGGLEIVGFYSAAFVIVNSYVGMVFSAMSTDYFPRLSAVANDTIKSRELMNQQAEIAVLILAPIIIIFIVCINWVIVLLYSNKFLPISQMVQFAMLGTLFKAISWSIAYIFLAKGARKIFLFNELIGGTVTLFFQLGGYYFGGLTGMGIGFMLGYLYYLVQVYIVSNYFYTFSVDVKLLKLVGIQLTMAIISLVITLSLSSFLAFVLGGAIVLLSSIYSYYELDKRIGINQITQRFTKRK